MKLGTIILWFGALNAIPQGWHVCDGSADTRDLREVIPLSAGGSYNVGDAGGAGQHRHTFTSNGHNHYLTIIVRILVAGAEAYRTTELSYLAGQTNFPIVLPPYHTLHYIQKMTPERPTEGY